MNQVRLYGKNRKHPRRGRCYWTDIEAWKKLRTRATRQAPAMVNVTSQTKEWSRNLSPVLSGPTETYRENGKMLSAVSVEVAWQYSKIYSHELVDGKLNPLDFQSPDGTPNKSWFRWRNEAWTNLKFRPGHPAFKANKKHIRRAFPKGSTIAGWYWNGRVLDAVTARREIYATLYCRSVLQLPAFQRLKDLLSSSDVVIYDIDGYDYVTLAMSPEDTIRELNHSWGHGLLLTLLLTGVDPTSLGSGAKPARIPSTLIIIKIFDEKRSSLKAALAEVDKLEALFEKIDGLVKKAGFAGFDAYVAKVSQPIVASDEVVPSGFRTRKPKANPKNSTTKAKRTPISDSQLAKMKELRGRDVPHVRVAKEVGVSLQSVYNWEKKKFQRR